MARCSTNAAVRSGATEFVGTRAGTWPLLVVTCALVAAEEAFRRNKHTRASTNKCAPYYRLLLRVTASDSLVHIVISTTIHVISATASRVARGDCCPFCRSTMLVLV